MISESRIKISGLSLKKLCSKGRNCHHLHIFKNPLGQYSLHKHLWLQSKVATNKQNELKKGEDDNG